MPLKIKTLLPVFYVVLLVLGVNAKTPVTVLPIVSSVLNAETQLFLADQFRQYLRNTDSFTVMTRDLMDEILDEQEFLMSEVCDQTSCMVQVGKLVGVKAIISVIVIENKKRTFSVSCKMVSVETGEIIAQASETRSGEKIETIEWMLRNVAGAIAGKPSGDHQKFLEDQGKILKKKVQRFRVALNPQISFPMHFFTVDPDEPRQKYYDTDSTIRKWGLPEKEFNYGLGLAFSMKLNERIWLKSQFSFEQSNKSSEFIFWQKTLENADFTSSSHTDISQTLFDMALGVETVLYKNPYFQFTVTAMPLMGYGKRKVVSNDADTVETKTIDEREYTGNTVLYRFENAKTTVDGFIAGGELGLSGSFNFKKNWSFDVSVNTKFVFAPEFQGKTHVKQRNVTYSPLYPDGEVSDSVYSHRASAVKGDFLGTGRYILIKNPDEKAAVSFKKSIYELSSLALRIGVSYYF
ncbi:MAG: CsgG/HfaB family protein [Fibrobacter sp.]|nr:CsgG/HfaB family protein [Fibrobacter sp.]